MKFLVVKERVRIGKIPVKNIGTRSMITYPLTKRLPHKVFHENVAYMGVNLHEDMLL